MRDGDRSGRKKWGQRLRGAAAAVGLLGASLVVAFGLGELLVRAVAPQQLILKRPDIWKSVDSLGWVHRENVRATINTGERTVHLYTDGQGHRVGARGPGAAHRRILVLGDSFLEALQVEYEESLPGLLERGVTERLGEPLAVRNTAVGGWDPRHYLLQAERSLRSERFDLVLVFLYLGNDVVGDSVAYFPPRAPKEVHRFRTPRSLESGEIVQAILYPINDLLEVRSHLFVLLKKRLEILLMRTGLTAAYFPVVLRKREADSPRWEITAELCARIAGLAAADEASVLFVLLPAPVQVDSLALQRYLVGFGIEPEAVDVDQPNRKIAEALARRGLVALDALPTLRAARRRGLRLYGDVDRHLTAAGHTAVAEWLLPTVTEELRHRPRGHPVAATGSTGVRAGRVPSGRSR